MRPQPALSCPRPLGQAALPLPVPRPLAARKGRSEAPMDRIQEVLSALILTLREHGYDPMPNQPATSAEITQAERQLEVVFPPELRDLYAACNGTREGLIAGLPLLSLEDLLAVNRRQQSDLVGNDPNFDPLLYTSTPPGAIRTFYWLPGWVALAQENDNYFCVDLDPDDRGQSGQIIACGRNEQHRVMAGNLGDLLAALNAGISSGAVALGSAYSCSFEVGNSLNPFMTVRRLLGIPE